MKITVDETKKSADTGYPRLMINPITSAVAIFSSERTGILLRCNPAFNKPNDYSTTWSLDFEPFTGTITLEND